MKDEELINMTAENVYQLREFKGEQIYLLLFDNDFVRVEYVGAISIVNIIKYIREHNLQSKISLARSMIIRGYVYTGEELPYDLDADELAYVIADDYDFVDFENMNACTDYIEEQLDNLYEDIDKFIVIVGNELSIKQQHRIINRILYNKNNKMGANNG